MPSSSFQGTVAFFPEAAVTASLIPATTRETQLPTAQQLNLLIYLRSTFCRQTHSIIPIQHSRIETACLTSPTRHCLPSFLCNLSQRIATAIQRDDSSPDRLACLARTQKAFESGLSPEYCPNPSKSEDCRGTEDHRRTQGYLGRSVGLGAPRSSPKPPSSEQPQFRSAVTAPALPSAM